MRRPGRGIQVSRHDHRSIDGPHDLGQPLELARPATVAGGVEPGPARMDARDHEPLPADRKLNHQRGARRPEARPILGDQIRADDRKAAEDEDRRRLGPRRRGAVGVPPAEVGDHLAPAPALGVNRTTRSASLARTNRNTASGVRLCASTLKLRTRSFTPGLPVAAGGPPSQRSLMARPCTSATRPTSRPSARRAWPGRPRRGSQPRPLLQPEMAEQIERPPEPGQERAAGRQDQRGRSQHQEQVQSVRSLPARRSNRRIRDAGSGRDPAPVPRDPNPIPGPARDAASRGQGRGGGRPAPALSPGSVASRRTSGPRDRRYCPCHDRGAGADPRRHRLAVDHGDRRSSRRNSRSRPDAGRPRGRSGPT